MLIDHESLWQQPAAACLPGRSRSAAHGVSAEIASGLCAQTASIASKYLYDPLGSKLFEAICLLPEYYPTRTEAAIFDTNMPGIARAVGQGSTLIDLGAGNCAKAAHLFPALKPKCYVPIDISADFLGHALASVQRRFPDIEMTGIGLDFSANLELPASLPKDRRVFFYPGSSIGNFSPPEATRFLRRMRAQCGPDGAVLLGVDLIKDKAIFDAAYADAPGVTAAFNLNILRHVNTLLGTNFRLEDWAHQAGFNASKSRVEMHLRARRDLDVDWPGGHRHFTQGECIHTENSYKYMLESFIEMLAAARFEDATCWTDARDWFAVIHARAT